MTDHASTTCIIYDFKWTKERDDNFLCWLDFKAFQQNRALTTDDLEILTDAVRFVNNPNQASMEYYDIYMRFQLAYKRFVTWEWIINHENVRYNPDSNVAETTPSVWRQIIKLHKLGELYSNGRNEHMWSELNAIFGPDSARILEISQPTGKIKSPKSENSMGRLDKLLREIQGVEPSNSQETEVKTGSNVVPLDVISTTKGKGELLYVGVSTKVSMEMNTRSVSAIASKGSCSNAKRYIDF